MMTLRTSIAELQDIADKFKKINANLTDFQAMQLAIGKANIDVQEQINQNLNDLIELKVNEEEFKKEYLGRDY